MIPARKSPPNLWLGLPVVLVLLTVWTSTDFPLDYWLHVNAGRWMSEYGQLIEVDTFSHTIAGQPVRNQAWLAQRVMYAIHQLGQYPLSQFLAGISYATGLALVIWLAQRRSHRSPVAAAWGLIAFTLLASNLGVRPQAASTLLFALQLTWLDRIRRPAILAFACLATEAIWTNVHGAFPLGVVLPVLMTGGALCEAIRRGVQRRAGWSAAIVAAIRSQRVRRLAIASAAAALGAFINPHPQHTLSYVVGVSSASAERGLEEWLPPHVGMPAGAALTLAALAVIGVLATSRRRLQWDEIALLVPFACLALGSQRMVAWWGLVLPWAMARSSAAQSWSTVRSWRSLTSIWQRLSNGPAAATNRWLDLTFVTAAIVAFTFCTPWLRTRNVLLPPAKRSAVPGDEPWLLAQSLPQLVAQATEPSRLASSTTRPVVWQLADSPAHSLAKSPLRSCAPLSWGSYLTWHSRGQVESFVDSRVDFFPDRVWNDYQRIQGAAPDALQLLDAYRVDLVVCGPDNRSLAATLSGSAAWREAYRDRLARAFVRAADTKPTAGGSDR